MGGSPRNRVPSGSNEKRLERKLETANGQARDSLFRGPVHSKYKEKYIKRSRGDALCQSANSTR